MLGLDVGLVRGLVDKVILPDSLDLFQYIAEDLETIGLEALAKALQAERREELRCQREQARLLAGREETYHSTYGGWGGYNSDDGYDS